MSVTTTSFLFTLATVQFIFQSKRHREILPPSLFACWFQPGLISQPTVFSSHNKPAPARLISPETNQRTGRIYRGVPSAESSRSVRGLGKGIIGKPYPRLCNARRPRLEPGTFRSQAVRLYRLHQALSIYRTTKVMYLEKQKTTYNLGRREYISLLSH